MPRPVQPPARRLAALDALRGFDMFWIVGADELVGALRKLGDGPVIQTVSRQLEHADWAGCHFEDLIFPLFVFLSGISVTFSVDKAAKAGGDHGVLLRLLRRAFLLWLLGVFSYGGIAEGLAHVRWVGVLQRIAICSAAAGFIAFRWRTAKPVVGITAVLLLGYWAIMAIPVLLGTGSPDYAETANLANWIDAKYLPGRRWDGDHDPEGLLSTIPAIATALLGVLAGRWIRKDLPANRKARQLALWGIAGLAAGWAWSPWFPVIKKLWTSSYVLVAGGWSALALASFIWIMDVRGWTRWAKPFSWVGANALAVYLLPNVLDLGGIVNRLTGGEISAACGTAGPLLNALLVLGLTFGFARFLSRRNIYLRV